MKLTLQYPRFVLCKVEKKYNKFYAAKCYNYAATVHVCTMDNTLRNAYAHIMNI